MNNANRMKHNFINFIEDLHYFHDFGAVEMRRPPTIQVINLSESAREEVILLTRHLR